MLDLTPVTKTFTFGNQEVTLETQRIARQASGAVLVTMGDVQVLAAVTGKKDMKPGQDFFPLTVNYQEKYYAAGKIPGGYIKRENRPSEKETLTSRLIDRPIRPLFPEGYMNEVQVVLQVMSADTENDPDIAAMIGASAALAISGIPFDGPIGAARVGYTREGGYVLNPTFEQLKTSELDMVVAGTTDAVLMVESDALELSEDEMLGGVLFAHEGYQCVIAAIKEFAAADGTERWEWTAPAFNDALYADMKAAFGTELAAAYQVSDKMERYTQVDAISAKLKEQFVKEEGETNNAEEVSKLFKKLQKEVVRERIVNHEPRIDGRDNKTVRDLNIQTNVLKGTHGSALFTRGETQSIGTVTLGSTRDAQTVEFLHEVVKDNFMFHYNFPPYSVGECGRMGAPGRREVGHGRLARRGVQAMMPKLEDFPYTVRVVSEITESNGSSSMASVCSASLALMDAGVPIKAPVAGIAMGLVKEGEKFAVLTDILGDEDHLGDMDFKVAGSEAGITALQMDIKIQGITEEIMEIALEQALDARMTILKQMNEVMPKHRDEMPDNAPTYLTVKIPSDKIAEAIGKGGATIRGICDETGADVDISDEGLISIFALTKIAAEKAKGMFEAVTAEAEVGTIYEGKVQKIVDFGAFVNILPGKDGLVHISQISDERVENVADHLTEGQQIKVKVLDVDNKGRIKLTLKGIEA
ncbi:polyribonucleotide nucleotidyltransferase [Bermanella sp. WJH001]|uniref:polyribonucleotide nucleotidyltransferase n=1 Tax=Bermanella sp. WJH001 TaxID=3048005 RepID=UPI0024BDF8F3|nr:polyribonucleotide nucleotidyltransferase [Bermanella sp. WJH001]MDJ1538281.1 polyribonucleotide nucleotidyltransferase [Bermanella sp. WJH001]